MGSDTPLNGVSIEKLFLCQTNESSGFASLPVLSPRQQASNGTGNEVETISLIMAFCRPGQGSID
jgi:hypothetical protein